MSEPRGPQWSDPTQGPGGYQQPVDPAYSGQYWGPGYGGTGYTPTGYGQPPTQPTEQFPSYWQAGAGYPPQQPPPPPRPPKSPRWMWVAAAAAVALVAGLVLALVNVMGNSKNSTVVAPLPTTSITPRPATPTTTGRTPIPSTTRPPLTTVAPVPTVPSPSTAEPTTPGPPTETATPTGTETVVYSVTGEGRAINITYVDTGGVMQTEFNVALPWNKEVSLAAPARNSASVAVVNVGRDVTCSVSVNGATVRQRSGRGLTICTGMG